MAAGRNNMHNSKTFEEVQIATEAFEDLCSMTRRIEKTVSLNGTLELAEVDYIITRDSDFQNSAIPSLSPRQFINLMGGELFYE